MSEAPLDRDAPSDERHTPSMIERVARSLAASYCAEGEDPDLFWKGNEDNHRRSARAAIAAMREPTQAMIEAAWQNVRSTSAETRMAHELMAPADAHRSKARKRFQAMVDAALTDPPKAA